MKTISAFCFSAFCIGYLVFSPDAARGATLINDTETEAVLAELVAPLASAAGIGAGRLKINIVNSDEFNAFVRGGEEVFVYTGLLIQIKSPAALQAVVAHELGHTVGGHTIQMSARMDAEIKRTMIIQALGIGLMVAGGNPSLGAGVLAGSSGIARQSLLAFSRDEERMADDLGISLMTKAGLNPNGFLEVFEQMNEITGAAESKINPNRVNHPPTAERLKNVRDKIEDLPRQKIPAQNSAKTTAQYELVRAKLIGYLENEKRVANLYPYPDKSDPAIYARAIANMRGGNLAAARAGVQTLISRKPENPYFYELLGDIEYQYGHYDDSVAAYEKSLALSKDAPQIQTALALVLSERKKSGDNARAIELCKRAILSQPMPLTYWVLARAYAGGRGDWALAEYYNMLGDSKNAEKHAKKARNTLPKNSPEYIKSGDLIK
ncbi:MAG: M48 family metalloprotease [Rickettsiales bacterium]|jgi:predicted Zn-dependent protease|nr:M48 family metalloprotease [Rickettsiales bacterium]